VPTWTDAPPVPALLPTGLPRVALTIRTANRKPNYVGATVKALVTQGVDPAAIHLCLTAPETAWLDAELGGIPATRHVPSTPRTPNENGLAQIRCLDPSAYDWVLLLEDDVLFCADFVGSVQRWLVAYARADRHVYRLCGFRERPPSSRSSAYDCTLYGMGGSQAVLLRMAEARDFLAWADANLQAWGRSRGNSHYAFDKLIAAWARHRWPEVPGVMSHPQFVLHVGKVSSLHRGTLFNTAAFAGERWSYGTQEATA
jgi:hypothetical protein